MPMQMEGPDVVSEAALSDDGMELQCGQKVKSLPPLVTHGMPYTAGGMLCWYQCVCCELIPLGTLLCAGSFPGIGG